MSKWNWNKYIEATKNRKPIQFLIDAIKILNQKRGQALDLGCGAGVDAKFMAENGFKVEAVDSNKNAILQTKELCNNLPVEIIKKDIAVYQIKNNNYDLIISWTTIPFLTKENSIKILYDIQEGLVKNGVFVFLIFGPEDDWAKNHPEMSFFTIEELKKLLPKLNFIKILEEKQTAPGATGEVKFWHKIQGIAQKK